MLNEAFPFEIDPFPFYIVILTSRFIKSQHIEYSQ